VNRFLGFGCQFHFDFLFSVDGDIILPNRQITNSIFFNLILIFQFRSLVLGLEGFCGFFPFFIG